MARKLIDISVPLQNDVRPIRREDTPPSSTSITSRACRACCSFSTG
jgi:hypothetical protein